MPGPMPRRSEDRIRRNKTNEAGIALKKGVASGVTLGWPDPPEHWLPPVVHMYRSFQASGMSQFYEDSDVALIYLACDGAQAWYDKDRKSPTYFAEMMSHLGKLGASEGERRRMQIELDSAADVVSEEEATVTSIAGYKQRNVFAAEG